MPRNQPPQIIIGVYRPPNRDVAIATYVRERPLLSNHTPQLHSGYVVTLTYLTLTG